MLTIQEDLWNEKRIKFGCFWAHDQNGVMRQAIGTKSRWSRAMLLYDFIHLPEKASFELLAFATKNCC